MVLRLNRYENRVFESVFFKSLAQILVHIHVVKLIKKKQSCEHPYFTTLSSSVKMTGVANTKSFFEIVYILLHFFYKVAHCRDCPHSSQRQLHEYAIQNHLCPDFFLSLNHKSLQICR